MIVLLALAAFFAGTVDAIAGGGGLITLPALLTAGLSPHLALGTNKGQSVWGSGAAAITFWRAGRLDLRKARVTFPLALAGATGGVFAVLAVPPGTLKPVVIVLLIAATALLIVKKPEAGTPPTPRARMLISAALALVIGAYDGFFGPGTGTFLIVGFVALCGDAPTAATADAKVVNFASNLASITIFALRGQVVWGLALPMAAAQLCGGVLGARLAVRGGAKLVRGMVVAVSIGLVIKLARELYLGL